MSLRVTFALIIFLLSLGVLVTPPASADPLGYLVNKIMEKVMEEKKEEGDKPSPVRGIPDKTKAGRLEAIHNGRQLIIDDKEFMLAFNSRIRDENNRIVHTGMVRGEKRIRYSLNNQQQVDRIWLLAPGEQ